MASCDTNSTTGTWTPIHKTSAGRITESLSVDEALLFEPELESKFGPPSTDTNPDVRARMQTIFAEVSSPANETAASFPSASTSMTPMLSTFSTGKSRDEGRQYAVAPAYKPTEEHARLPSTYPVDPSVKAITTGRSMLALFDNEIVPRTKDRILVETQYEDGQVATAILDARLTLAQICSEYPRFVRGSLLRVFSNEGWTPETIWNNLASDHRQTSPGPCAWAWLDEALDREMALMILFEAEAPTEYGEEAQYIAQSDSTPTGKKRRPKTPDWTAAETDTLFQLKDVEGKTHKAIGAILGRSGRACVSRYHKIKKRREAAAAENTSQNNDTPDSSAPTGGGVDNSMAIEGGEVMVGGQVEDPMLVD